MDVTTIAIIFVGGLLAIGLTAYMLNRAWGDFPTRLTPPGQDPAPPSRQPARVTAPAQQHDEAGEDDPFEKIDALPAGAPPMDTIPITHPLIKRSVEQAMEKGGSPYATYFFRDGDQIFFAAYRIADPVQRAQATRLFQALHSGDTSGVNFGELIRTIQQLGK